MAELYEEGGVEKILQREREIFSEILQDHKDLIKLLKNKIQKQIEFFHATNIAYEAELDR